MCATGTNGHPCCVYVDFNKRDLFDWLGYDLNEKIKSSTFDISIARFRPLPQSINNMQELVLIDVQHLVLSTPFKYSQYDPAPVQK